MHAADWRQAIAARIDAPPPVPPEAPPPSDLLSLPRHGQRPLQFHGRLLAEVQAAPPDLPVASRVALFEADAGGFVVAISHRLQPPLAAEPRDYAAAAADAAAVLALLHAHDPLRDLPPAALLPALSPDEPDGAALAEAAALLPRLRGLWRALLTAGFGPSPHPDQETPDERDQRL